VRRLVTLNIRRQSPPRLPVGQLQVVLRRRLRAAVERHSYSGQASCFAGARTREQLICQRAGLESSPRAPVFRTPLAYASGFRSRGVSAHSGAGQTKRLGRALDAPTCLWRALADGRGSFKVSVRPA